MQDNLGTCILEYLAALFRDFNNFSERLVSERLVFTTWLENAMERAEALYEVKRAVQAMAQRGLRMGLRQHLLPEYGLAWVGQKGLFPIIPPTARTVICDTYNSALSDGRSLISVAQIQITVQIIKCEIA